MQITKLESNKFKTNLSTLFITMPLKKKIAQKCATYISFKKRNK